MEAFLISPANSCPCHQATSCHVILHHIMSYYAMYQTCFPISSSVKGYWFHPLWSDVLHTSWGKYAWIHVPVMGQGVKTFWTHLGGQHFWNPWGGGCCWGKQNRPHLDSQKRLNDYLRRVVKVLRHLTELLANLPHNLIIFPYIR